MKIVLDTETKQAICPPEFFESVRKINDASELTGSTKKLTSEDYLQKIIADCSKVLINKSDMPKKRGSRRTTSRSRVANLVIEPNERN